MLLWPAVAALAATPPAAGIASAHPLATRAGHEILSEGGNAFDAAVAMAAALAVVEPSDSGLGGGGFWLLHRSRDRFEIVVDARERAPRAATAAMYLDDKGAVIPGRSRNGPLAAGIPGMPAGLAHIAQKYGRLPLARSLAPAIRLAQEGFAVSGRYQRQAQARLQLLSASPAAARIFLQDAHAPAPGYTLRQPELAQTLMRLAQHGRDGFYAGVTARLLVEGVTAAGGIWSLRDLTEYQVVERQPLYGVYGKMRVTTAPPPSSGVALIQMLNILRGYPFGQMTGARRVHVLIETMRLAYRDRARYLGDPDFVDVDVPRLISSSYANQLRREIQHRATPSTPLDSLEAPAAAGRNTTHLSVLDRDGNRVAATLSINGAFGSGFVPPETGVLLNNEMDDFVAKPGEPNLYGLVGTQVNAIAPGKRPLSSMTPTFLETDDAVVLLGTPGGSRIVSMVLLAALDFAHGRGRPDDWVARRRLHHQYLPDVVEYEDGALSPSEVFKLEQLGHKLKRLDRYGNMQLVIWYKRAGGPGRVEAYSDPRGEGRAEVR